MTATSVLLPIIRRVMPTIMANCIIYGTYGAARSKSDIFTTDDLWKFNLHVVMNNTHYRHFLRVYNRRTHHPANYITDLGYQKIRISRQEDQHLAADQWCTDNLNEGSYVRRHGDFWFAYNDDAVLFKMTWL